MPEGKQVGQDAFQAWSWEDNRLDWFRRDWPSTDHTLNGLVHAYGFRRAYAAPAEAAMPRATVYHRGASNNETSDPVAFDYQFLVVVTVGDVEEAVFTNGLPGLVTLFQYLEAFLRPRQ